MSNVAIQSILLAGIRAVGSKDDQGIQYGGVYYPAHSKNGKQVSARWEGNFAMNSRGYTDNNGVRQEGKRTFIRLVVWNGKNATAGKGLADSFAKCMSVGKELTCAVKIESFDKRMFLNGQPVLDAQGNAITYPAVNFRVDGDVDYGADSNRVIAAEIAAYQGQMNFFSRPALWNVAGHADNEAWKAIVTARMATGWDGQAGVYGYARVIVPEGAVVGNAQAQAGGQVTTGQVETPIASAQGVVTVGTSPTAAATILTQPAQGTVAGGL